MKSNMAAINRYAIEILPKSCRFTKLYRNVTKQKNFNSSDDKTLLVPLPNTYNDETYRQFKMAAAKQEVVITLDL